MTWHLKKSRGLFFARTGEPRRSYWASDAIVTLVRSQGREVPRDLLEWDPSASDSRSNCPMLHEMLAELVDLADPRWRARAQNIYAGRTWSTDDTAFTDQNVRSGMIALSNEFTSVLIAYASVYGMFLNSMDDARKRSPEDAAAIQHGMRVEFDRMVDAFKIGGLLALKGTPFMVFPSVAHWNAVNQFCRATEQWTLAHELSHHLARDLSSRRDKGVAAVLAQLESHSIVGPEVAALSASQRCEVEADLLATLILAGYFLPGGCEPAALHFAVGGAAIALITVGHLHDEWSASSDDSHPGYMDRLRLVMTFVCELYGTLSVHKDPRQSRMTLSGFSSTLMAFAHWAQDVGQAHLLGEAVRTIQRDSDMPNPALLVAHYATSSDWPLMITWEPREPVRSINLTHGEIWGAGTIGSRPDASPRAAIRAAPLAREAPRVINPCKRSAALAVAYHGLGGWRRIQARCDPRTAGTGSQPLRARPQPPSPPSLTSSPRTGRDNSPLRTDRTPDLTMIIRRRAFSHD